MFYSLKLCFIFFVSKFQKWWFNFVCISLITRVWHTNWLFQSCGAIVDTHLSQLYIKTSNWNFNTSKLLISTFHVPHCACDLWKFSRISYVRVYIVTYLHRERWNNYFRILLIVFYYWHIWRFENVKYNREFLIITVNTLLYRNNNQQETCSQYTLKGRTWLHLYINCIQNSKYCGRNFSHLFCSTHSFFSVFKVVLL